MNARIGEVENAGKPEWEDMQVLLRFGLGHLTHASFLLLRVRNRDAARAWLAVAPLTNAVATDPPPMTALQIALTSEGLRALGVAPDIVDGFSNEYVNGMSSDAGRSRGRNGKRRRLLAASAVFPVSAPLAD